MYQPYLKNSQKNTFNLKKHFKLKKQYKPNSGHHKYVINDEANDVDDVDNEFSISQITQAQTQATREVYAEQKGLEQRNTSPEVDEICAEDIDIDMMGAINRLFAAYGED